MATAVEVVRAVTSADASADGGEAAFVVDAETLSADFAGSRGGILTSSSAGALSCD